MSRGRKPGFKMPEEHRAKIANSQILKRLIDHVEGKIEMSSTQITAGLGLLRKCMPDLSSAELNATVEHRSVMRMPEPAKTSDEWQTTAQASFGSPIPSRPN
jgi:hypothetical protein